MMLSDNDLTAIAQSAQQANRGDLSPEAFVQRVIDFLDGTRQKFEHGGWNPGKWFVKQALDTVIAALHQWIQTQEQKSMAPGAAAPAMTPGAADVKPATK